MHPGYFFAAGNIMPTATICILRYILLCICKRRFCARVGPSLPSPPRAERKLCAETRKTARCRLCEPLHYGTYEKFARRNSWNGSRVGRGRALASSTPDNAQRAHRQGPLRLAGPSQPARRAGRQHGGKFLCLADRFRPRPVSRPCPRCPFGQIKEK